MRDYDGTALAGVSLSSQPSGAYAQTDTNGHYEMHLPSGIHCVSASKYPRPAPAAQAVTVPPSQTTVDFVFPRYYTISGTVRGSDGTALGSVEVRAVGPSTGYDYTGSDGSYELTVLTAGTYVVTAQQNGRLEQATATVTVPPNRPGTDLTFPQAYAIAGTVRDTNGVAMSSVYIDLCPIASGICGSSYSQSDGTYRLLVPAGTWRVSAEKYGFRFHRPKLSPFRPLAPTSTSRSRLPQHPCSTPLPALCATSTATRWMARWSRRARAVTVNPLLQHRQPVAILSPSPAVARTWWKPEACAAWRRCRQTPSAWT